MKTHYCIRLLLLFCFFILGVHSVYAQDNYIQLTSNDGLSNSAINCITQTKEGIMWFGTWDGLNSYNATKFKNFKPSPEQANSISNNIVHQVIEQDSINLWIATAFGINRLNQQSGEFTSFLFGYQNKNIIKEKSFIIAMNSAKVVFSAVYGSGLYYWGEDAGFKPILLRDIPVDKIIKMFFDTDDNLYLAVETGEVYRIEILSQGVDFAINKIEYIQEISFKQSLHYEKFTNTIFFHNKTKEVYAYNIEQKSVDLMFSNDKLESETLNEVILRGNSYYFATTNGLFSLDRNTNAIDYSYQSLSILSIYLGTQGVLWVGTDGQGVMKIPPTPTHFPSFNNKNIPQLGHHAIRCFFESSNNVLWTGTKGGGLYRIVQKTPTQIANIKQYKLQDGLLSNSVYALAQASHNDMWIGTDGFGLNYYDASQDKIETLNINKDTKGLQGLRSIYSIYPQNDTTLWVGTSGNGIYKLHISTTRPRALLSHKHYKSKGGNNSLSNNIVYSILPEADSVLWLATRGGGLNRLNIANEKFEVYRQDAHNIKYSLSNDDVLCLGKDKEDNLWIGTSMGLNKMVNHVDGTIRFMHYTEAQGMPNNTIHGVVCDQDNKVWVSSNRGMSSIEQVGGEIINYYQRDGLQSNEFSDGAYYHSPYSSKVYFGGINGFNTFMPEKIERTTFMPKLVLNSFSIDNQEVSLFDYIDSNFCLMLEWSQKFYVFNFAILDYLYATKCELAYRLVPHNDQWIEQGTSHTISLSNIPSGDYVLEVRYTNSDKIDSKDIYRMPIHISTPWWFSTWAFLFYAILLVIVAILLHKFQKMRYDLAHSKELEIIEMNKIEDIHQAKLRFFTNIAHEFSNHLSLIYGPAQLLLSQVNEDDEIRRKVITIKNNAERMQSMIKQLMEFRKIETGHLALSVERIDLEELTRYIIDNFQELSAQKNIKLSLHITNSLSVFNSDRSALEKIIFNLLSNAFKYTPEKNSVSVNLSESQGVIAMKVTNTGVGIAKENQSIIFDRFKTLDQIENRALKGYETRTGIGLAVCKNLIDLLQGTLEIDSDGTNYTSFIVKLHSLEEPNVKQEDIPQVLSHINIEPTENNQQLTLLIIDDEKQIRTLIKESIHNQYNIEEANNGEEGLACLAKQNIDLIITDLRMPIMDGAEFVKTVKANKQFSHIPIIMLSSLGSVENQIEGLGLGANNYIPKPFHPQHLEAIVARLLDNKKTILDYAESPQSHLSVYNGQKIKKTDIEFLEALTRHVIDNMEEQEINQDQLANKMLMSKVQLYRKIKELSDLTPTEFIRNIRLKEVERLLKSSTFSIQEIMYKCGFNNKSYFYRVFAKKYKCTPKEYRQNLQEE